MQLALLCKSPLSTMTSTSYCLPGMRPTSWMRCSVTFFPRVVLSTRAERFQRSRWYRSKSPAGGSQFTRRVLSQPPPPAFRSETFWGTETQRWRKSFPSGGFQARHNWTLTRHASEHSYCAQLLYTDQFKQPEGSCSKRRCSF